MSRCDIEIEFQPPDREFRTGETVRGRVRVTVGKESRCRGLYLNGFWKTHGRGDTARKNYFQQTLFQGQWSPAETCEYPFEFEPPATPLSYHGKYLNIDHFVSVRADIPWARDARREEEFLWRIGERAAAEPDETPLTASEAGCGMKPGLLLASLLASISIVTAMNLSWWFLGLLFPALGIAFLTLRRTLAERVLGEVRLTTPAASYAGEPCNSSLRVGPLGNTQITAITAEVSGRETVVSGSGKDRTTHTHSLYRQKQTLLESPSTRRGETLQLQPAIAFPETEAWSVDLPDNQIVWSVTFAIRQRRWPDWVLTRQVRLLPRPRQADHEAANLARQARPLGELVDVARRLAACGADTEQIDNVVAENADRLFTVRVEFFKTLPAAAGFEDPEYASGRTLSGTLTGTEHHIWVRLPARYNEEADRMSRGQSWSGAGALIHWDHLTERLVILGIQETGWS